MKITRKELIKRYLDFFKSKDHKEIPNSSLVPQNDPTVLFTTAGMHPIVPYLLGQAHPLGKRLVNVQRCIRTGDIDEVGDDFHLTFFEMLGNWSLGDYFKKEAITYSFEFLTKIINLKKEQIKVTCFVGDKDAEKDEESAKIWQSLGIKKENIKFLPKSDNWWGPAGNTGPCGPDTEMFIENSEGKDVEIWNDVFMQYIKNEQSNYIQAKQKNVDTGMGVERTLAILNRKKSVYETEVFQPIIKEIEKLSNKKYNKNEDETRAIRIIADHIKASIFIIADGVIPSNTERGYVLRRLIRRAIRYAQFLGIKENFTIKLVDLIINLYQEHYPELKKNRNQIITELDKEERKFRQTLEGGIKMFEKITENKREINCKDAFLLYQSYGFPIEMTQELAKEKNIKVDEKGFQNECNLHQELSKTASQGQFKSGLADNSEQTKKLHTATHLLNEALKQILNKPDLHQKGSNITPERTRFDFNFDRKLTEQELKKVEDYVNDIIKQKLPIKREEMPYKKAIEQGAKGEFGAKYPEVVSVYSIEKISKEICTGPHVNNTSELGKFKIIKEESSSAGVRRIKAKLE
jgi:alanyl-tRNA synthetase